MDHAARNARVTKIRNLFAGSPGMTVQNALLPSPPFVLVEGINNFRDVGGYPVRSGAGSEETPYSVRRGLVYRCADPSMVTETGKEKLRSLGVRTIFDLRSIKEVDMRGDAAIKNVESIGEAHDHAAGDTARNDAKSTTFQRVFVPAFPTQDSSPEQIALRYAAYMTGSVEGFTQAYRDILMAAGDSYRTILLHLRDHPAAPIICHCTAGKDRTGVIIALILKLAGVEDEVVAQEYQLTEVGLGPMREEIVQHLLGSPSLEGNRGKAERMIGARKEYMIATLAMLRDEFGGVERYVKRYCGLTDEDIVRIREAVVVPAAPIHYTGGL